MPEDTGPDERHQTVHQNDDTVEALRAQVERLVRHSPEHEARAVMIETLYAIKAERDALRERLARAEELWDYCRKRAQELWEGNFLGEARAYADVANRLAALLDTTSDKHNHTQGKKP